MDAAARLNTSSTSSDVANVVSSCILDACHAPALGVHERFVRSSSDSSELISSTWPFSSLEVDLPLAGGKIGLILGECTSDDGAAIATAADAVVGLDWNASETSGDKASDSAAAILFNFDVVSSSVADEAAVDAVAGIGELRTRGGVENDEDRSTSWETNDLLDTIVAEDTHVFDGSVVEVARFSASVTDEAPLGGG